VKVSERLVVVLSLIFVVVFAMAVVVGGIYFGLTGFFALVGVTYESIGTLMLFILYCLLLGVFFELVEAIIIIFLRRFNIHSSGKFFLIIALKLGLTWVLIHTVNAWMDTITFTLNAELWTTLLIVAIDVIFDDEKRKE